MAFFGGRLDLQAAGHIDRHRLGHVDVQAGLDGRLDMFREEARRRLQRHGLHAALDQPAVARQAGEAARLVDAQRIARRIGHLWKVVGHGVHLVAAVLAEQARDPGPAAAAADHAQLDLARRRRDSAAWLPEVLPTARAARHRRAGDEFAARELVGSIRHLGKLI